MFRKLFLSVLVLGLAFSLNTGCMNYGNSAGIGPYGLIFTSTKIGTGGTAGGSREGRACATSLLVSIGYGFAFGTVDVGDAARDGNIKVIKSVHREILDVLGLFGRHCTVVVGDDGQVPGPSSTGVSGFSDTVILKNGASYTNCKAAVTGDSVVVTTSDGKTIVLSKADVQTVQKK
ncbi:MAG: hypothetical protein JNM27_15835 [Leptospirales bacterium]|nr:hypothetical protein [Leptospirales bacterium]